MPQNSFTNITKQLESGFEIPVFGLGTWQMGGRETRDIQNDDKKDIVAIQKAIELGVTHIDTAESYADGHSETLLGIAIENYDRSKLFLTSKVRASNLKYDDVLKSCEASLKRIKTDYLDLYLIHAPSPDIPIQETLRAMDKLVADGLVQHIGVSNFTTKRLIDAQQYTSNKIVVNQVYYNLMMREPEHEGLLRYCQENDVFLEAYRPLEKGMLLNEQSEILTELTKKYQKTPAQIAINWLLSQENVIALAKSSSLKHLTENLGAVGWKMDTADIEKLRKDFPNQVMVPEKLPLR